MNAEARAVCDRLSDLSEAIVANDTTRAILVEYLTAAIVQARMLHDNLEGDDWLAMDANIENADYIASGILSPSKT